MSLRAVGALVAALGLVAITSLACGPPCRDRTAGAPFCVPDGGASAAGVTLQLKDLCTFSCGAESISCHVERDGGGLELTLRGTICGVSPDALCAQSCAFNRVDCLVGPLPPGTWSVSSPGHSAQTLVVVADGGEAGCTVTLP